MTANFDIVSDPSRDLMIVTVQGFFSLCDFEAFEKAYRAAMLTLRCGPNQHVVLADASAMAIQSQEIVSAFAGLVRDGSIRSRRLAFVVGVSLARQQTQRLVEPGRDGVAFFHDRIAAERWLLAPTVSDDRTAFRYRHAPASPMSGDRGCIGRSAA